MPDETDRGRGFHLTPFLPGNVRFQGLAAFSYLMTASRPLMAVTLAAAATAAAGAWRYAAREPPPAGLVVITLDTTRADRLPLYGYMNVSLPHVERLAAEGVVFDQATSVGALTLPAHASLFTGLLPPRHGIRDNADLPLDPARLTLAEVLKGSGWRTAAFVGSVVLNADRGLAQGFDHYGGVAAGDGASDEHQRPAGEVVDDSIRWLESIGDDRFLLWVHLYDPHRPYDPPAPFRSVPDPYVGEIAYADSQIGRLLDALDRRTLLDRTVVVVAGDHGESLGEHGERDHGIFVYESVLRVPLIVKAPALAPRRVTEVVRLTDVMPTVLDLLGVPAPPADGISLAGLMRGRSRHLDLEAYAESLYPRRFGWSPLYALRDGRYKFIEAPRPELYDLERDPFEQRNVHDQQPAVASAMRRRLAALTQRGDDTRPFDPAGVPEELRRRLASLGYVGHASPDPKDCIGTYMRRPVPGEQNCH